MTRALTLIAVLTGLLAGTASSAATPGWSTAKAAARVTADVRLPWCRVYTNWQDKYGQPVCANGRAVTAEARAHEPLDVGTHVSCTGLVATRGGFRRLRCDWAWTNAAEHGTVIVYVTGPTTFRWKSS